MAGHHVARQTGDHRPDHCAQGGVNGSPPSSWACPPTGSTHSARSGSDRRRPARTAPRAARRSSSRSGTGAGARTGGLGEQNVPHAHGRDVDAEPGRSCAGSARAGGCGMPWAAAARCRGRHRHPGDLPNPRKRSRATAAWPTSPSRCRGLARARSACRAPPRRRSATCRGWPAARPSPPSRLSESQAGSDVAAMLMQRRTWRATTAVLNGEKTWISNGGIADFYVVF